MYGEAWDYKGRVVMTGLMPVTPTLGPYKMMYQSMIEKVANAIRKEMVTNTRWHAETIAKAAIKAMGEHTKEINKKMTDAALNDK